MKDGTVRMNPGIGNPEIEEPVDITDPQLVVLRIDRADNTPLGAIVNYALHLDTLTQLGYSADYPGVIRHAMRKQYGEAFGFLFFTGCCGNVNHLDVTASEQKDYLQIGAILSREVQDAYEKIVTQTTDRLDCTQTIVLGSMRRPTQEECDRQVVKEIKKEMERALSLPIQPVNFEVWTALIGAVSIQMLPGEIFARFGLTIKQESKSLCTAIA